MAIATFLKSPQPKKVFWKSYRKRPLSCDKYINGWTKKNVPPGRYLTDSIGYRFSHVKKERNGPRARCIESCATRCTPVFGITTNIILARHYRASLRTNTKSM